MKSEVNIIACAALAAACGLAFSQGCQKYVSRELHIRDAVTHQPVKAHVEVAYSIADELGRLFDMSKPSLKRCRTETGDSGVAIIKIAPDLSWFLHITPVAGDRQIVVFNKDWSPNHTFGTIHYRDGWFSTRTRPSLEVGTLEVRISDYEHGDISARESVD